MSTNHPSPGTLNIALLERLKAAAGEFVAADRLGDDPDRIRRDLGELESFGFRIECHPYLGAAYRGPAPRLCPDQIEHELGTRRIGRRVAVWSRVTSTNDLATRAGSSSANDGLVILAEEQTAGRGQRGRTWSVPPRSSLLMSVVLFPPLELAPLGADSAVGCAWLTALGAVATAEVVAQVTGRDARIKWPNDVRVDGRKIAGILVERVFGGGRSTSNRTGAVLGIGLNVNVGADCLPADVRERATSIQILADSAADRSDLARRLIRRLDDWYEAGMRRGPETLGAPWRDLSEHLGQRVLIRTQDMESRGILIDLDLREGLTLELATEPPRRVTFPLGAVLGLEA